ncbi:MAG TPA: hypothetical protein VJK26_02010 [Patescibacteria group bacterium]|nr:hypothetical protein [Patescibacteria group bacterium]
MRHKCLASLLVFVLYFTISLFIGLAEIRTLLKTETILKTLSAAGIYESIPKYFELSMSQSKETEPQAKILGKAIADSIDPINLRTQVEKNLPPLLTYLNGRGELPDISLDLRIFKANLAAKLPAVFSEEIINLPSCEGEDNLQNPDEIPNCLPTGTTAGQLEQEFQKNNVSGDILKNIPDTWGLRNLKNPEQFFGRARLSFKILNYSYWGSLITSIILIGFLVLLGRSYWPSIPRWVGLSLFLPGVSALLMTIVSIALPSILLGNYGRNIDPEILKMLNPLVISFNQASQKIALLYSGVITGLGFVLILLSYILPHPPEPTKPAPKPTSPAPHAPAPPTPQPAPKT